MSIYLEASITVAVVVCFMATFLCACILGLSGRISREQGDNE